MWLCGAWNASPATPRRCWAGSLRPETEGDPVTDRQLVLNLFSPPFEAWRQPDVDAGRAWSIDALVRLAQDAERALFDAIFLADSPSLGEGYTTPEPFTVLSVI